jgi:hypothetical protein
MYTLTSTSTHVVYAHDDEALPATAGASVVGFPFGLKVGVFVFVEITAHLVTPKLV